MPPIRISGGQALLAAIILCASCAAAMAQLSPPRTTTPASRPATASAPASMPPEPLAAKYPDDAGIEKDPAVVFADNFDAPDASGLPPAGAWDERSDKGVRVVAGKVVQAGSEVPGKNILQLACWGPTEGSAGIHKFLGNYASDKQGKGPGLEEVYIRYYQRLDEGYTAQANHGANVGGRDLTRAGSWWSGQANCRDVAAHGYFYSGLQPYEVGSTGKMYWGFYSYHMDKPDAWGDDYRPAKDEKPPVEVGRWYCLERHLKLNSVDPVKADGLEELWVDGQLAIRRDGLRFRSVPELRITVFELGVYYHHCLAKYDQKNPVKVSYDNVVIARSYIGPIAPAKTAATRPSR